MLKTPTKRFHTMIRDHHERGKLPPAADRFRLVNYVAELQTELRQAQRLLDDMDADRERRAEIRVILSAGSRQRCHARYWFARRRHRITLPLRLNEFIRDVRLQLDPLARLEFREPEQWMLKLSMEICGMTEYPPVVGDPQGERASGDMICERCGNDYRSHPVDWRVMGYGHVPFLNVLCSGERVKL